MGQIKARLQLNKMCQMLVYISITQKDDEDDPEPENIK